MTERLPAITSRQLVRVLEKSGWRLHRTRAFIITVPVHGRDLKRGLVAGILKDAGISRDELLRLL